MLQRSSRSAGFIEPCLPSPAKAPPAGDDWLSEIKHDGFRILARRDAAGVWLYSRNGHDFGKRFPLIVAAVAALPARSCLIDGEAIVSDASGLAVFELLRSFRHDHAAVLCAFGLLEFDGQDLRGLPIEQRKQALAELVSAPHPGNAVNEHYVGDGAIVYRQACRLVCEGIVCSGSARPIAPADRSNGSKSRTRRRRPFGARLRKSGANRPSRMCCEAR